MNTINYLDFDLQITLNNNEYLARVLTSPVGQAQARFIPPFSIHELDAYTDYAQNQEAAVNFTEVGSRLFAALFQDNLLTCLHRSLDEAQSQNARLRIKLRLTDVPELFDFPWEYLYDKTFERFLALSTITPLIHYLELPSPVRPLLVSPPLRILVVIASPSDLAPINAEQEWSNLQNALYDLINDKQVIVERLDSPTLPQLQRMLRRNEYHVFHFVGHGTVDQQTGHSQLAFVNEATQAEFIGVQQLKHLILNENTLRLIVLNACQTAHFQQNNPFLGMAQAFVQQGVPAVVAMQFQISDQAAILFSHEFYAALADGYSIDTAVTEARVAISTRYKGSEWGACRLFMRANDGLLWHIGNLSVLTQYAQIPAIHEQVIRFRTDLQVASAQIDVVNLCKSLHDLFHELQTRYRIIEQECRRLDVVTDGWQIILQLEPESGNIIHDLLITAQSAIPVLGDISWLPQLNIIRVELHSALEQFDLLLLKRATQRLQRLLRREPSRINTRLVAAVNALRLDSLLSILEQIQVTLYQAQIDVKGMDQYNKGITALADLHIRLRNQVTAHDRWQELDDELLRVEGTWSLDNSELKLAWPDLSLLGQSLYGSSKEDWAVTLMQTSTELEEALALGVLPRIQQRFYQYRSQTNRRFQRIDKELLSLCNELHKIAESLDIILDTFK